MASARPAAAAKSARTAKTRKPPARTTRTTRTAARTTRAAAPRLRIRWDRAGRIGLLVVLAVVAGLYVQHALTLLATHSQAQRQRAIVARLAHSNAALIKQSQALNDPRTIEQDARALGMVKPGERPYVITGTAPR